MKRYLTVLLTALLLCGCAAEPQSESTIPDAPQVQVTTPTAPVIHDGLYEPGSNLEAITNGALQIYPLNRSDAVEVVRMGEDLLLFSGEKATTLTKLSGDNRYISAVANLNCLIRTTNPAVKVSTIS